MEQRSYAGQLTHSAGQQGSAGQWLRALAQALTNTLCEYVCGEKLMSTRVNALHLT